MWYCDVQDIETWFSSGSWLQALSNPGNFPSVETDKGVLFMLMRQLLESQTWFEVWNFWSHPLISTEGRGAEGWTSHRSPMANDLINHVKVMWWSLLRNPKGASRLLNMQRCRKSGVSEMGMEAPCLSPIPCPVHFFPPAIWVRAFYNKQVI